MAIRLVRPSEHRLRRLLADAATDSLTYSPTGISSAAQVPAGYRFDRYERRLGSGDAVWRRACAAIADWQVHRDAGLTVCSDGPLAAGANVAMSAPLPVGHVDVVCRVVSVDDRPDCCGFAYGTLSNHPEQGEETFRVVRRDDDVVFEVVAAWRPRHLLAKTFRPIASRLQRSATERYFRAMADAVSVAES